VTGDDEAVRCSALTKTFGARIAVDRLDLELRAGESLAVIGPNGAGKTTTIRMIACMTRPSSGSLRVLGLEPARHATVIRHRIGVVQQHNALDRELSVLDNLRLYGRYYGMSAAEAERRSRHLLDFMKLTAKADAGVRQLSGGQARRLSIARALINDPALVLLDEPTTGLDPQARQMLWQRLRTLRKRGTALLITSHYMPEVEQLCDRVLLMADGRIVTSGHPRDLVARHCSREVVTVRLRVGDPRPEPAALSGLGDFVATVGDRVVVHTPDARTSLRALGDLLTPEAVHVRRSSLEDAYLRLTGLNLTEERR